MLLSLSVRDFVVVEALELDIGPGFTVLTGETGAGKSILIDALQLALGERADSGVIRGRGPAGSATLGLPSIELRLLTERCNALHYKQTMSKVSHNPN